MDPNRVTDKTPQVHYWGKSTLDILLSGPVPKVVLVVEMATHKVGDEVRYVNPAEVIFDGKITALARVLNRDGTEFDKCLCESPKIYNHCLPGDQRPHEKIIKLVPGEHLALIDSDVKMILVPVKWLTKVAPYTYLKDWAKQHYNPDNL